MHNDSSIKAVHWFGREWPVNFWTSRLSEHARGDFEKIKADGFNAVVLVLPWLGFINPDTHELSDEYFSKCDDIVRLLNSCDLRVIFRVGYAWNAGEGENKNNIKRLFADASVYEAWLTFVAEVGRRYGHSQGYLFAFISWEDYWPFLEYGDGTLVDRLSYAARSGFRDYLTRNYTLSEVQHRYRLPFGKWDDVPIPARRTPAFRLYMDYYKELFVEKLFKAAALRAPRLSAEVRVDLDPIYDGEEVESLFRWEDTWSLPGAEWVSVYFNPYYGTSDTGQSVPPDVVNKNLDYLLRRVRDEVGDKKVFIDQFNFRDDTPGMTSDFITDEDLPDFLNLAANTISALADGYALWFYHGYEHCAISNPDFAQNLRGWDTRGNVRMLNGALILSEGAYLERVVSRDEMQAHVEGAAAILKITGTTSPEALVSIVEAPSGKQLALCALSGDMVEVEIEIETTLRFRISAVGGAVTLRRISVVGFAQKGTVYDRVGAPLFLANEVRDFNAQLWNGASASELGIYSDGWIGKYVRGFLTTDTNNYAAVCFEFFVPEGWPNLVELLVTVNGIDQRHQLSAGSQSMRVVAPVANQRLTYTIRSPDAQPGWDDGRALSCILVGVREVKP